MLGRSPRPPRESSSKSAHPPSESVGIELVQHDHSSNLFPIIVVREHKQIGRADSGAVVVGKWSKRKQKEMSISPHSRSGTAAVHSIRLQEEVLSAAR